MIKIKLGKEEWEYFLGELQSLTRAAPLLVKLCYFRSVSAVLKNKQEGSRTSKLRL